MMQEVLDEAVTPSPTSRNGSDARNPPPLYQQHQQQRLVGASPAAAPSTPSSATSPGPHSRQVAALLASKSDGVQQATDTAVPAFSLGMNDSSDAILKEAESLLARHDAFMRSRAGVPQNRGGAASAAAAAAAINTPVSYSPTGAIALVAVSTFDLREGPTLLCTVPPLEDSSGRCLVPAALRSAVQALVPFKSLPENGLAATQLLADGSEASAGGAGEDRCMFLLRAGEEVLFGASHFVRLQDGSARRGFSQAAVVVLARVPYMGVLLQRLHAFSTEVLHTKDCGEQLTRFHASLARISFSELGYSLAYQELPVTPLLLQLGGHVMSLLRLMMLEGRVLLHSRSGARVSAAAFALAALLPGTLALGLRPPACTSFEMRAYRWRKYGFPLRVFRGKDDARFEPLLVMAEAAEVLRARSFLAGTTNAMIQTMAAARLDCLVDLDKGQVSTSGTPLARAAFAPGDDDCAFAQSLVAAAGAHVGAGDGAEAADAGWEGSSAWAADQFQLFFEELAVRAAGALARHKADEQRRATTGPEDGAAAAAAAALGSTIASWASAIAGSGRRNSGSSLAPAPHPTPSAPATPSHHTFAPLAWLAGGGDEPENPEARAVAAGLEEYGRPWARAWVQTENWAAWRAAQEIPDEELLTRPKHRNILAAAAAADAAAADAEGEGGGGARHVRRGPVPQSGHHSYTFPSGDTYVGWFENSQRHGTGLYTERSTGTTYDGEWVQGRRHGRGVLTSGGLDLVYDGEWKDDERTGQGECVINGRETYTGWWLRGHFHGQGKHCDADGNIYEGEFSMGVREGAGRLTATGKRRSVSVSQLTPSRSRPGMAADADAAAPAPAALPAEPPPQEYTYVGEWRAGKQHGLGQCNYCDRRVYSGQWRDGKWHGEGRLILADGSRHEGEFAASEQHGIGVFTTADGDVLEGEWKWGKPVEGGEWHVRFANGDDYVGAVALGGEGRVVPHGQGTYKYTNGDVFTGDFDHGVRSGQGVCCFANGEQFSGAWAGDAISLLGRGQLTLADGSVHHYT